MFLKRTLRKSRSTREDNIRLDLREIRWEGVDWIYLAQDRDQFQALVKTVMNLLIP
jgi:hypothetical protein